MTPQGMYLTRNVILNQHHDDEKEPCSVCCLRDLEAQEWLDRGIDRLTQHYGDEYNYRSRRLTGFAKPLTSCSTVKYLSDKLSPTFMYLGSGKPIDQCIVNQYLPGQDISKHTDHTECFGPIVGSVSFGSTATMIFTRDSYPDFSLDLNNGDALVLSGESRYLWKHRIPANRNPQFKRISVT